MCHGQGLVACYSGGMASSCGVFSQQYHAGMYGALVSVAGFDDTCTGDVDGEGGLFCRPPVPLPSGWDHPEAECGWGRSADVVALDQFGDVLISNEVGMEVRLAVLV